MAQNATIFKAELQISDMDRHYYASHALTLARHPSETDERLMVRVLAFILNASEELAMGKGISSDDEPDLWQKDLTGAVEKWIEIGQPDEKRVRRACGLSREVIIYPYSGNSADVWWEQNKRALDKLDKVSVVNVPVEISDALGRLAQRTMQLQATIQDGEVWITDSDNSLQVMVQVLKGPR
ncbi:MAG: YaeQ family protein [Pedobacter sp.]|nr:YaeQ family protein [Pedobacter sp.]